MATRTYSLIFSGKTDMAFHTDLSVVLDCLDGRQSDCSWLITDCECNFEPAGFELSGRKTLLKGAELMSLVQREARKLQFIWAVVSSIAGGQASETEGPNRTPFANGNRKIWEIPYHIQSPQSVIEIICWDSTYTILSTTEEALYQHALSRYKSVQDFNLFKANQKPR